jgi:hypothetical protein
MAVVKTLATEPSSTMYLVENVRQDLDISVVGDQSEATATLTCRAVCGRLPTEALAAQIVARTTSGMASRLHSLRLERPPRCHFDGEA